MTLQLLPKILKHSAMSSRKSIISSSKVLDPLNTILAAHTRKTQMESWQHIPEGMSIRCLNLMKGCSRRNQESPGHHLKEEIILNLIHELCDEHQTKQFQTLIGQLQWLISLGHFDIAVHVMSLSRFRAQPREGHLDRAKRIVGYLLFLPDGAIRFRTGEPDFSSLKDQEYDWTRSVYPGVCEQIPHDIPKALGKHVQTTHYVDANLHHDLACSWKSCYCSFSLPKPNTN